MSGNLETSSVQGEAQVPEAPGAESPHNMAMAAMPPAVYLPSVHAAQG